MVCYNAPTEAVFWVFGRLSPSLASGGVTDYDEQDAGLHPYQPSCHIHNLLLDSVLV